MKTASISRARRQTAGIGISCDEITTPALIETLWRVRSRESTANQLLRCPSMRLPQPSRRRPGPSHWQSAFMQHPVFHRHSSETELLRYMRRLADRDLALDRQ